METIAYGFLLGIGILLAILALAAIVFVVVVIGLFVSYMWGRRKKRGKTDSIVEDGKR